MEHGYISENLRAVRENIDAVKRRLGIEREITVVAAVKYADADEIRYLCSECGVRELGENRVQQLLEHYEALGGLEANWHFIGTLQTNKVKYIADKVCMIHSVDSVRLAREIDRQAKKHGRVIDVLVEINSGAEENKSGVLPEEAEALCLEISQLENRANTLEQFVRNNLTDTKKQQTGVFISMGLAIFGAILSFIFNML